LLLPVVPGVGRLRERRVVRRVWQARAARPGDPGGRASVQQQPSAPRWACPSFRSSCTMPPPAGHMI